jgi:hypothetical protein
MTHSQSDGTGRQGQNGDAPGTGANNSTTNPGEGAQPSEEHIAANEAKLHSKFAEFTHSLPNLNGIVGEGNPNPRVGSAAYPSETPNPPEPPTHPPQTRNALVYPQSREEWLRSYFVRNEDICDLTVDDYRNTSKFTQEGWWTDAHINWALHYLRRDHDFDAIGVAILASFDASMLRSYFASLEKLEVKSNEVLNEERRHLDHIKKKIGKNRYVIIPVNDGMDKDDLPDSGMHWTFMVVDTHDRSARSIDGNRRYVRRRGDWRVVAESATTKVGAEIIVALESFLDLPHQGTFKPKMLRFVPHQTEDNLANRGENIEEDNGACGPYLLHILDYLLKHFHLVTDGLKESFTVEGWEDRNNAIAFNSRITRNTLQRELWEERKQQELKRDSEFQSAYNLTNEVMRDYLDIDGFLLIAEDFANPNNSSASRGKGPWGRGGVGRGGNNDDDDDNNDGHNGNNNENRGFIPGIAHTNGKIYPHVYAELERLWRFQYDSGQTEMDLDPWINSLPDLQQELRDGGNWPIQRERGLVDPETGTVDVANIPLDELSQWESNLINSMEHMDQYPGYDSNTNEWDRRLPLQMAFGGGFESLSEEELEKWRAHPLPLLRTTEGLAFSDLEHEKLKSGLMDQVNRLCPRLEDCRTRWDLYRESYRPKNRTESNSGDGKTAAPVDRDTGPDLMDIDPKRRRPAHLPDIGDDFLDISLDELEPYVDDLLRDYPGLRDEIYDGEKLRQQRNAYSLRDCGEVARAYCLQRFGRGYNHANSATDTKARWFKVALERGNKPQEKDRKMLWERHYGMIAAYGSDSEPASDDGNDGRERGSSSPAPGPQSLGTERQSSPTPQTGGLQYLDRIDLRNFADFSNESRAKLQPYIDRLLQALPELRSRIYENQKGGKLAVDIKSDRGGARDCWVAIPYIQQAFEGGWRGVVNLAQQVGGGDPESNAYKKVVREWCQLAFSQGTKQDQLTREYRFGVLWGKTVRKDNKDLKAEFEAATEIPDLRSPQDIQRLPRAEIRSDPPPREEPKKKTAPKKKKK